MPKNPTYPTLFDECMAISISDLLRWGYLELLSSKSGIITWTRRDKPTGSIFIATNAHGEIPYLEFDYLYDNRPIKYRVELVTVPSNVGKGVYWFFICPHTGKRCRKLYLIDGYFYHRSAFRGCMYEKQTYSTSKRDMDRALELLFGSAKLYEQIHSKHFKQYYAGAATKRYKKIWSKIVAASQVKEEDILKRYR